MTVKATRCIFASRPTMASMKLHNLRHAFSEEKLIQFNGAYSQVQPNLNRYTFYIRTDASSYMVV